MDIDLSQAEADALIAMSKYCINDNRTDYPDFGGALRIPLVSENKREEFMLDITRGRIALSKCTFQNRSRQPVADITRVHAVL
ncbi:prophage protein [Candidatus Magnetobacterium bavaricum]|uniref:Prophage protein n=1 Tax=Candidatus Magnetobacterium bavaricum TaxID=29290 RepID=A0A0F3GPH1_9BACT|nr:prophage protein [Candidatus Magnetobacterium bavaricum]